MALNTLKCNHPTPLCFKGLIYCYYQLTIYHFLELQRLPGQAHWFSSPMHYELFMVTKLKECPIKIQFFWLI